MADSERKNNTIKKLLFSVDSFLEKYEEFEKYFHEQGTCVYGGLAASKMRMIWWPYLLNWKNNPIVNIDLTQHSIGIYRGFESLRVSLVINNQQANQIIETAIRCTEKIYLDIDGVKKLFDEYRKTEYKDWVGSYEDLSPEAEIVNDKFDLYLNLERQSYRMEQAGLISKAIDDLGLRELAGENKNIEANIKKDAVLKSDGGAMAKHIDDCQARNDLQGKQVGMAQKELLCRISKSIELFYEFRRTFFRYATVDANGRLPINVLTDEVSGIEGSSGNLEIYFHGNKCSCRFKPRLQGDEKCWSNGDPFDYDSYEEFLFSIWSYDTGFALNKDEMSEAVWFICDQAYANMLQDLARKIEELLNPITEPKILAFTVACAIGTINNQNPKWKPGRVAWSYIKELDERIRDLELTHKRLTTNSNGDLYGSKNGTAETGTTININSSTTNGSDSLEGSDQSKPKIIEIDPDKLIRLKTQKKRGGWNTLIDLINASDQKCGIRYKKKLHGAKQPDNLQKVLERSGFSEAAKIIHKKDETIYIEEGFKLRFINTQ